MTLAEKIAAIRNVAAKRGLREAEIADVINGWMDWEYSLPLPSSAPVGTAAAEAVAITPQLREILTEAGLFVWYEEQRQLGRLA